MDLSNKTPAILSEGWQKKATELFKSGKHYTSVAVELGLNKDQHNYLIAECEEYRNIIDNGMFVCEAYWLDWAVSNVDNKAANIPLFKIMVERMFRWEEKIKNVKNSEDEKKNNSNMVGSYLDKYTGKNTDRGLNS